VSSQPRVARSWSRSRSLRETEKDQKGIANERERSKGNLQLDEAMRFGVCQKKPAEESRLHFAFDI